MSQELLNRTAAVVATARARGAAGVRAELNRQRNSRVEWRDDALERLRESTTMGLSLNLYVDGRYSVHNTSDLRPDALKTFVADAVAMTRLLAADEHRRLPDPARFAGQYRGDLGEYDPTGAAGIDGGRRRTNARAMVEGARSSPGAERIISASGSWSDSEVERAMVTSNGMQGYEQGTSFFGVSVVSARDADERKPRAYDLTGALRLAEVGSLEQIGRSATARALAQCGARPIKTGVYPCVVENRVAETPLQGLLSALGGDAIQQQRSFLADKLGQAIGNELLTVTDDPHVPGAFSSTRFDSEGMATRRWPIFESGVLRNFYLGTYTASKLGMEPTIAGSTNLVFPAGQDDLEGLLAAMGTGILVSDFRGGNSNDTTGDFSAGVSGFWVENGVRVHPISEMNVGGNHLELWKLLVELGNDPYPYSNVRIPSLRFSGVQFSGV